jgi:HlyD family secretion protein
MRNLMRYIKYVFILFITAFIGYNVCSKFFAHRGGKPCFVKDNRMTISTIEVGDFVQWIPQTAQYDSLRQVAVVPIDELYLNNVTAGLKGLTASNDAGYALLVTRVDSTIVNGRFTAEIKFDDDLTSKLRHNQSIRVRICLGNVRIATLLPVGGFYRDTGGEWVLVLQNGRTVEKRSIKLGYKNTEYFEVLEGLREGEEVITSTYLDFMDDDEIDLEAVQEEIDKKTAVNVRRLMI